MRGFSGLKTGLALVVSLSAGAAAATEPTCCASGDHGGHLVASPTASVTDLGRVSPAAINYSQSTDYAAYVFTRDGVRYIEIADAQGTPRVAFTVVGGGVLSLPVGVDAVKQVSVAPAPVVYEDSEVQVGRSIDAAGATLWQVFVK